MKNHVDLIKDQAAALRLAARAGVSADLLAVLPHGQDLGQTIDHVALLAQVVTRALRADAAGQEQLALPLRIDLLQARAVQLVQQLQILEHQRLPSNDRQDKSSCSNEP